MSDLNGIVNIKKPPGITSFRVVSYVRKTLSCKKAGHTGTLDPSATGVLPVCLGRATKVIPYIPEEEKEYIAEIRLGITTDTLDNEGEILEENNGWQNLDYQQIKESLSNYIGHIEQIPPMYSAIHHEGKRLYQLARQGKEVKREPRNVEIKEIEILEVNLPFLKIRVLCSKGTYIRTLADDIGKDLKTGAHLSSLIRTKSGPFLIEESVSFEELKQLGVRSLIPMDYPLDFPELFIIEESLKKAENGSTLMKEDFTNESKDLLDNLAIDETVSIYYENQFISISTIQVDEDGDLECKPVRVFNVIV
ncbi:MAG: tRNA pseudouridine(55) synthase TruB [Halanaerobiales bacterium]